MSKHYFLLKFLFTGKRPNQMRDIYSKIERLSIRRWNNQSHVC